MINFDLNEIDPITLHERAASEAKKIATNTSFKMSGRTYEDLITQCRKGHAAELYLIDILGWKDDIREYKDVIDPDGYPVEIKVTGRPENIPTMLKRFTDIKKNQTWMGWPDSLIIFINPIDTNKYEFYNRYEWKKNEWRIQH